MKVKAGANAGGIVESTYVRDAGANEKDALLPRVNGTQTPSLEKPREPIPPMHSSLAPTYPRATYPTDPRQANLQLLESVQVLREILRNPTAAEPLAGVSLPSLATFEDVTRQLVDDWQLRFFRLFAPAERRELSEMLNEFREQIDALVAIAREPNRDPSALAHTFGTILEKNAALARKLAARLDKCRPFIEPVRWSTLARISANLLIGGGLTAVGILAALGVIAVAWWVVPLLLPLGMLAVTLVNVSLAAHEDRIGRKHDAWSTLQGPVDAFGVALAAAKARVDDQLKSAEVEGAVQPIDERIRQLTDQQSMLVQENEDLRKENGEILHRLEKLELAFKAMMQPLASDTGSGMTPRILSPLLLSVGAGADN